jgi:hypothetical protein
MPCSPRMTQCKRSCLHRKFVSEYQTARSAAEEDRDVAVGAYGSDSQEWDEYGQIINFQDWLIKMKGWNS